MEYISNSEKETFTIAKMIARKAQGGDIFALWGDLGSGKTTFSQGFAKALGVNKNITSPTFVILKRYPLKFKADFLIHADCYRLSNENDIEAIGLEEYFVQKNVIILIEWPEKIQKYLPKRTKNIHFQYLNESKRKITLD